MLAPSARAARPGAPLRRQRSPICARAATRAAASHNGAGDAPPPPPPARPARPLDSAHRPVGLVAFSAWALSSALALSGAAAATLWLPAAAGGAVGALYGVLDRARRVAEGRRLALSGPLGVVVTGGTRGVGKALAREFLRAGDAVVVLGRAQAAADAAAAELAEEVPGAGGRVSGLAADVGDAAAVEAAVAAAAGRLAALGLGLDVLVCNAGCSGAYGPLAARAPEALAAVVRTNLLGTLLCARAAARAMAARGRPGHIFLTEGAGSDGAATPGVAAYGATKAALAQLAGSLQAEALEGSEGGRVRYHTVSPGMVLTPLLLDGAPAGAARAFDLLAEQPETAAAFLAPRMRAAVADGVGGRRIRYLTPISALARLALAPALLGRHFDARGAPRWRGERERLLGAGARRTARAQRRAARRLDLDVAYAFSLAAAFAAIAADCAAQAGGL